MSILFWNARGVGNKETREYLKLLKSQHGVMFMVILEPKLGGDRIAKLARMLNFQYSMHYNPVNSHIWLLWDNRIDVSLVATSSQQVSVRCIMGDNFKILVSCVYAKCDRLDRKELWDSLVDVSTQCSDPWIVGGDFNIIAHSSEKLGGVGCDTQGMDDFISFQSLAGLSDAGYEGSQYTWCNNQKGGHRIWQRLDRILVNGLYKASFPAFTVQHLSRLQSDHSPLLIAFPFIKKPKGIFRFQRMWLDHQDFQAFVKQQWDRPVIGNAMDILYKKLQMLRRDIKDWNWQVFGHVQRKLA